MHVCIMFCYVCMYIYLCMYVCMYVRMYIRMYVCTCVCDFEHISPLEQSELFTLMSKQDSVFILHIRYTLTITNVNLSHSLLIHCHSSLFFIHSRFRF